MEERVKTDGCRQAIEKEYIPSLEDMLLPDLKHANKLN